MRHKITAQFTVDDDWSFDSEELEMTFEGLIGVLVLPEETIARYRAEGNRGMFVVRAEVLTIDQ